MKYIIPALLCDIYYILLRFTEKNDRVNLREEFALFYIIWIYISLFFYVLFLISRINFSEKVRNIIKKIEKYFFFIVGLVLGIHLVLILTPSIDEESTADYVILLGGGMYSDGTLADVSHRRVLKCAEYLNNNEKSICIPTGGRGRWNCPLSEAEILKNELIKQGISDTRIIPETKAKDTIENLKFSYCIILNNEEYNIDNFERKSVAIVTSRFHLKRAEKIAKRLGYKTIFGIGSDVSFKSILDYYLREILANIKLNLRILFLGEPKIINSYNGSEFL